MSSFSELYRDYYYLMDDIFPITREYSIDDSRTEGQSGCKTVSLRDC